MLIAAFSIANAVLHVLGQWYWSLFQINIKLFLERCSATGVFVKAILLFQFQFCFSKFVLFSSKFPRWDNEIGLHNDKINHCFAKTNSYFEVFSFCFFPLPPLSLLFCVFLDSYLPPTHPVFFFTMSPSPASSVCTKQLPIKISHLFQIVLRAYFLF